MGALQRYLWPKAVILFHVEEEKIVAAFGFLQKDGIEFVEHKRVAEQDTDALATWYADIMRTYPRTYLGAMLETTNQGALPSCGKRTFEHFGVDAALVHEICIDNKWSAYTSLVEMKWFEQLHKELTFDLLFSPFVLLYEKCRKRVGETPEMFVLHRKPIAYLMLLSQHRMWFASILTAENTEVAEKVAQEEDVASEDLGFDLELLDDEDSDITPISDVDVLGDFKESETEEKTETEVDETALEDLEYTMALFDEVKQAIKHFYEDDRYEQTFIEKATVFDATSLGKDLARYMEDELFMETAVEPFDPIEAMVELVAVELEK